MDGQARRIELIVGLVVLIGITILIVIVSSISGRYILMIRDLLASHDIPLILGAYPYGMTVGPDQWAEGRVYWGFEKGKVYDSSTFRNFLQRFADRQGLPLIGTFADFRAAAKTEKLYYDWDGHMTPAGHRVIAARVLRDPAFLALLDQRLARLRGGTAFARTASIR